MLCKTLLLICAFIALSPVLGMAEDQTPSTNAIELNLFMTVGESFSNLIPGNFLIPIALDYQHVLTDHLVLRLAPRFYYSSLADGRASVTFDQIVEIDWHPYDSGFKGFILADFLDVNYSAYIKGVNSSQFSAAIGPVIGYEVSFANGLLIDLSIGVGMGADWDSTGTIVFYAPARIDVGLGYSF